MTRISSVQPCSERSASSMRRSSLRARMQAEMVELTTDIGVHHGDTETRWGKPHFRPEGVRKPTKGAERETDYLPASISPLLFPWCSSCLCDSSAWPLARS